MNAEHIGRDGIARRPRRWILALVGTLAGAVALGGRFGEAYGDGYGANRGKILVSDAAWGGGWGSDAEMVKALHKQAKGTIKGEGGSWTLNLMVFLKEAAGGSSVNIVYYDVTGKRDQVNFSEVQVQPSQKILQLNDIALSKDLGFVAGHKYEILATRLLGGKEKVYAKGNVTLK